MINTEKFKDTFAYIDNVTVCRLNQSDYNHKLKHFMAAVIKNNPTLNYDKCFFGVRTLNLLGYTVNEGNTSD